MWAFLMVCMMAEEQARRRAEVRRAQAAKPLRLTLEDKGIQAIAATYAAKKAREKATSPR